MNNGKSVSGYDRRKHAGAYWEFHSHDPAVQSVQSKLSRRPETESAGAAKFGSTFSSAIQSASRSG